jgi:hypothetical protein
MIPVTQQPEPASFDATVRQRGARHLARQAPPVRASSPFWRDAIPDLQVAYDDTCAYLGFRVPRSITFVTVDHFTPRDTAPHLAYEWTNFRLAATTVNTYKSKAQIPVDPFTVQVGEFALNIVSGEVEVGVTNRPTDVGTTIKDLRLNHPRFVNDRLEYIDDFLAQKISRDYLAHWFPYGEAELARQGI